MDRSGGHPELNESDIVVPTCFFALKTRALWHPYGAKSPKLTETG